MDGCIYDKWMDGWMDILNYIVKSDKEVAAKDVYSAYVANRRYRRPLPLQIEAEAQHKKCHSQHYQCHQTTVHTSKTR